MITKEMVNNYLSEDYDEWIANVLTDICNDPHSISTLKKQIILEIREILNLYQDTMTKDVEQSLKNLIDYIEGVKDE